jgi:UDP:flavonoid glycosyltransferase YjiC (YdhE family)
LKIVILTIGTFGDVQPYVALGIGLREAGYEVRFATHEPFRGFVESHGLPFVAIEGDPISWTTGGEMKSLVEASGDFGGWMRRLKALAGPLLESIFDSCLAACRGADAIIYSPLAWVGYSIAEKLKIPSFSASMQPFHATSAFPSAWAPPGIRLGPAYNRATHLLVEQAYWRFNSPFINRWRKSILGLPPIPVLGPYKQERWNRQHFLFGYSPTFLPRPDDWAENYHVTGYWFLNHDHSWQPGVELVDFIQSASPPVYVGFGSLPDKHPQELLEIAVTALQRTKKRGVLLKSTFGLPEGRVSDDLFSVGWTPHDWLFPRMSAIVHHGGASTVANCLRSGVPSLVVPSAWDQPFWGKRIAELGVGAPPIPRKKLSVERLASAIEIISANGAIRERAGKIGDRILCENGVREAVKIVDSNLQKGE